MDQKTVGKMVENTGNEGLNPAAISAQD